MGRYSFRGRERSGQTVDSLYQSQHARVLVAEHLKQATPVAGNAHEKALASHDKHVPAINTAVLTYESCESMRLLLLWLTAMRYRPPSWQAAGVTQAQAAASLTHSSQSWQLRFIKASFWPLCLKVSSQATLSRTLVKRSRVALGFAASAGPSLPSPSAGTAPACASIARDKAY